MNENNKLRVLIKRHDWKIKFRFALKTKSDTYFGTEGAYNKKTVQVSIINSTKVINAKHYHISYESAIRWDRNSHQNSSELPISAANKLNTKRPRIEVDAKEQSFKTLKIIVNNTFQGYN